LKVKKDFITNSSSTSYVFAIPEKLNITIEEIKKYLEEDREPEDFLSLNEVYDECLSIVNKLKNGEVVIQEDFPHQAYSVVVDYLYHRNLNLCEIDTDNRESYIIPITIKTIEEIILAISLYDNQDIIEKIINEKCKVKIKSK